jgi:hypothetical protein
VISKPVLLQLRVPVWYYFQSPSQQRIEIIVHLQGLVEIALMSWTQIFFVDLREWEWVGILLARLTVGLLFLLSGRGKLFRNDRRQQMQNTLREAHIPFPELNALLVSVVSLSSVFF